MKEIRPALLFLLLFTVLCGGIYPAVVTGIAQAVFPRQARGSLIEERGGRTLGSSLIGQPFSSPRYFWPRPSASTDFAYNPGGSGGSNSGPTNPEYLKSVADRVKALREAGISGSLPAELVQASASGLDPEISPEGALLQIPRISKATGRQEEMLRRLVAAHTKGRQLGFLGEPRVNVLELNLELDAAR